MSSSYDVCCRLTGEDRYPTPDLAVDVYRGRHPGSSPEEYIAR